MSQTEAAAWTALAHEGLRTSSVVWLTLPGSRQPRIAWHVWHDDAALVIHGGSEQQLPGLDQLQRVEFCVRSSHSGALLVRGIASAHTLSASDPGWAAAAAALHAHRQSPTDGGLQPSRWAAQCTLTCLVPLAPALPSPAQTGR